MRYISLLPLAVLGAAFTVRAQTSARAPEASAPRLSIEMHVESAVLSVGERLDYTATLINDGPDAVTVVLPGDGSTEGWRTPVVRWTPPMGRMLRCGNMNPPKPGEVITLVPKARVLLSWLGFPKLKAPGLYSVSVEMENIPDMTWKPACLDGFDGDLPQDVRDALAKIYRSTPFKATSNVVEVRVEE